MIDTPTSPMRSEDFTIARCPHTSICEVFLTTKIWKESVFYGPSRKHCKTCGKHTTLHYEIKKYIYVCSAFTYIYEYCLSR